MKKSRKIRTIHKDIDSSSLGHSQCHEHIYLAKTKSYEVNPALCIDDYAKSLEELRRYKEAGGDLIVDSQPTLSGRAPKILAKLADESNVKIIATTGFHKTIFYYPDSPILNLEIKELTKLFQEEITEGMLDLTGQRSQYKPGVIKFALDEGGIHQDRRYSLLFEAVARAAADSNLPIMVHTDSGEGAKALKLISYLKTYQIEPERIYICHLDRMNYDFDYHQRVLDTGASLCYDSVNRLKYLSHQEELDLISEICQRGYSKQVVLSLDTTRARLSSYGGDLGLDYILKDFIPMLKDKGIKDSEIKEMCQTNAQRILSLR